LAKVSDIEIAELAARAGAKMVRVYIAELRRQGKIKGKLTVIVKEGKNQVEFPFREDS